MEDGQRYGERHGVHTEALRDGQRHWRTDRCIGGQIVLLDRPRHCKMDRTTRDREKQLKDGHSHFRLCTGIGSQTVLEDGWRY